MNLSEIDIKSKQRIFALLIFILIIAISQCIFYFKEKNKEIKVDNKIIIKEKKKNIYKVSSSTTTPQFILLSFDGSKSNNMWKETLDFADKMNASNTPLHFTYFINSAYLLSPENSNKYLAPHKERGQSAIGYSDSVDDIEKRIGFINKAFENNHEIASHASGHWLGEKWSIGDWIQELDSFDNLLFNIEENNNKQFNEKLKINKKDIKGFRAPELSLNEYMYIALSKTNYKYDSSEINVGKVWPYKDKNNIWHIPISQFYFPNLNMNIIAVDYSIWVNQTNAQDILIKGTEEWQIAFDNLLDGYKKHFDNSYNSNRIPIVIDNHFSKWNDGLYWEVMKEFAKEECSKIDVRCSTFSEFIDYMESK